MPCLANQTGATEVASGLRLLSSALASLGLCATDGAARLHTDLNLPLLSCATEHDAEADSIVASLFGREASGSSFPASTSTHSATSESSRSRRLFGRKDRSQGASVVTSSNSTPAINTVPATPIDDRANPLVDEGRGRNNNSSRLSARSMSPFFRSGRSRSRARSPSPGSVGPLRGAQGTSEAADTSDEDEGESDAEGHLGPTSYGEVDDGESSFLDNSDVDSLDEETELNTEANAETSLIPGESGETPLSDLFQDIPTEFGEGPNIVLPPPEPFPVRSSSPSRTLPVDTGRPEYGRDRCTMKMTQGDPEGVSEKKGHRQRRYVVASDLSEESGYAVEWAIGTVARDGDESESPVAHVMLMNLSLPLIVPLSAFSSLVWVVNVCEDEAKVDPKDASTQDRVEKIRNQKERQTLAQLLSRQVLSLLTRTNLNVDVVCQAVHTKNARHLLLVSLASSVSLVLATGLILLIYLTGPDRLPRPYARHRRLPWTRQAQGHHPRLHVALPRSKIVRTRHDRPTTPPTKPQADRPAHPPTGSEGPAREGRDREDDGWKGAGGHRRRGGHRGGGGRQRSRGRAEEEGGARGEGGKHEDGGLERAPVTTSETNEDCITTSLGLPPPLLSS